MKVILSAINAKYIHSNLAVYSLKSYVKSYADEIEIAEYTINQQLDDVLMDLYKRCPDVLCFSCYIWNISYIETLTCEIHKLLPETHIWVGGPEVSYDATAVLERMPELTGVMFGEGEATFSELMDFYHGCAELEEIDGVAYRDCDGAINENAWRKPIDLSAIPFIYHNLRDFENKIVYYESSRGCPFSCSYCLSSVDKCLRFRDLELVKQELQCFIDAGVPQVKFVDRTFNCNHTRTTEIWSYLIAHDRGVTNFHFEVAADLLNEEELQLIERMRPGLIQLEIGVQSTNEGTIREIHRTMNFEKVAGIVTRIKKSGNVHQHLDLIAGLPHEDLKSFRRSFDDVYALHPEQLQLGFLKVLKGSYMAEQKERYGLSHKSCPPYEVLFNEWLSYDDILVLKMVEEMVEVYYNSGQFSNTLRYLEQEFDSAFELYLQLGYFYENNQLQMVSHSRIARYEILLDFIRTLHTGKEQFYCEALTYDLYLRENVKNRPTFAGAYRPTKEEVRDFYEKYEKQQCHKITHLEVFSYDIMGNGDKKEVWALFDYQKRNPLTHEAQVFLTSNLQKQ